MLEFEQKMLELMDKRFDEQNVVVEKKLEKIVNGKIDAVHEAIRAKVAADTVKEKAMNKRMDKQDAKLKNIERTTGAAVRLYNGGSTFVMVTRAIAKYISIIGGAALVIWETLKFLNLR